MKHINWIDWHMHLKQKINVFLDYVTFNVEQFPIVACFCLHDMNVCVQADAVV